MALLLALVALLILSILGVTSAQTAIMQERMVRNARDVGMAFHSAEAALGEAEALLEGMADLGGFPAAGAARPCNGGFCNSTTGERRWRGLDWGEAGPSREARALPGLGAPPRYVIELLASRDLPPLDPSAPDTGGALAHYFRITARGLGARPTAVVWLQTRYAIVRGGPAGLPVDASLPRGRLSWRRLD